MPQSNLWSDVSAIAQSVQHDAYFIVREAALMPSLVTTFTDMSGLNTRKSYKYNSGTAKAIGEADDLTSEAFTPSADQTLTPSEIGLQFFISDSRKESEAPESIMTDAARELGFAATDKLETDLMGDMASLTGGTIGASGTAITWSYLGAAITVARAINKNAAKPLVAVIHGYQWNVLAKSATIAGATVAATAPDYQNALMQAGGSVLVARYQGVPVYQVFGGVDSSTDFTGGVFPREALALDWRRTIRIEAERDPSRRGTELNMSAVYAHGVWRPALGVKMIYSAAAPTA
jgi:hypothetical protein